MVFFPKNGSEITPNFYYIFWYILMSLCYVESLSWFRVQFFELWPFLKISQFLENTLYYSPCFFPKNGPKIIPNFYYIFWYILMSLCYVESLSWFRVQFFELWPFLKISQFLENTLYYSPCFFPKNGSEITPNFYYIFWYILMYLCYVESLSWIWVQFFELWPFLKIGLFLKNTLYYSPCFFPKNGPEITPNFYYIFWYILMSLCCVESLSWFRLQFFELWSFLKIGQFLKNTLYYSPCFFLKNGSEITPNFYYIFWYILMSLCYVESLSWFRLKFFDLWPFLKMANFWKIPCTIAHGFFFKKWLRNHPQFLLHFLIHIDVLMLCRKFELIPTSIFRFMAIFKNGQFSKNTLYYSPWFFFKKWLQNHPQFFYIFWYILMSLCYVESLSWFRLKFFDLWPFLKMANFWKIPCTIAHGFFFKKWLRNHPQFLLHFLIHIDALMLCRKFELIPTSIFRFMAIFKNGQFLKNTLYYSPWFFFQKMAPKSPPIFITFSDTYWCPYAM